MEWSLIISLLAIIFNIITLCLVIKQTNYTRKSFEISNENLLESKNKMQLDVLDHVNLIYEVSSKLKTWNKTIFELKKILIKVKHNKDFSILSDIECHFSNPILERYIRENSPNWLYVAYEAGAKWYLSGIISPRSYKGIIPNNLDEKLLIKIQEDIKRADESINNINQIINSLEYIVPIWYENCPDYDSKWIEEE